MTFTCGARSTFTLKERSMLSRRQLQGFVKCGHGIRAQELGMGTVACSALVRPVLVLHNLWIENG
jgi:hypothetical protein